MALQLNIVTIGGENLAVTAIESWLVRDLKLAIERDHNFPCSRQRLFHTAGEELHDDRGLIECCPVGVNPQTFMLVKVPKTQEEIEFCEKWLKNNPEWLQVATESVMDNRFFSQLLWTVGAFRPSDDPKAPPKPRCKLKAEAAVLLRVLKTAKDVLSVAEAMIRKEDQPFWVSQLFVVEGDLVLMQRVVGMESSNVAHATIEAMVGAVAIEPHLMLPCADDDLVCAALRSYPELFRCMREELRQEFSQEFYQSFLYDALELDDEIRQEFLRLQVRRKSTLGSGTEIYPVIVVEASRQRCRQSPPP